jgi:aspartate aminotransferase
MIQQQLAARLSGVSESATLRLNALVQQMKANGEDVINLTAGEPDFPVPDAAKAAINKAVLENKSKYTPVPGIIELRKLIAHKTNLQHAELAKMKKPWDASNVVVSNGGKQAIFQTLLAVLNAGDEVLIPSPFWLSYPEMVKLCGGRPITLLCPFEKGFKLSAEQLDRAISDRTRVLILNSPSNPSGVTYTEEEFKALGEVIRKHPKGKEILVISDEIYDRILYTGKPFVSFLAANPDLFEQTVTVNGLSKSAAMTGWRVGWTVAPKWITDGILTIQGQSTSGINALAQYAGLAAMQLPEESFAPQVASFHKRRDLALETLEKATKLKIVRPEGAFYIFIGVEDYYLADEESGAFAERLLKDARVAVVPGTPFGAPGFLRLSFATDEASLKEGCERIVKFLNSLS